MDIQICWYCGEQVPKEESVSINIDGAEETVHEACSERIAESVS